MKAAIVAEAGAAPVYGQFNAPEIVPGHQRVRVTAASISHITRSRASGSHYSEGARPPFIPGLDGAGVTEDGRRVYFILPAAPYGSMGEISLVDERRMIALPDGLDDVDAAAMAIPAMSAWAALAERARLRPGETVLVNGATGVSGRLAVQVARHLGAGRVIATGRDASAFDALHALGADEVISLAQPVEALEGALTSAFRERVDVVLDYLYGPSAQALLVAAARGSEEGVAVRFVQIGSVSGADITVPAAALRASGLVLMGSGIGSVPMPRLLAAVAGVLSAAPQAGFRIATQVLPLAEVSAAWAQADGKRRIVLRP